MFCHFGLVPNGHVSTPHKAEMTPQYKGGGLNGCEFWTTYPSLELVLSRWQLRYSEVWGSLCCSYPCFCSSTLWISRGFCGWLWINKRLRSPEPQSGLSQAIKSHPMPNSFTSVIGVLIYTLVCPFVCSYQTLSWGLRTSTVNSHLCKARVQPFLSTLEWGEPWEWGEPAEFLTFRDQARERGKALFSSAHLPGAGVILSHNFPQMHISS